LKTIIGSLSKKESEQANEISALRAEIEALREGENKLLISKTLLAENQAMEIHRLKEVYKAAIEELEASKEKTRIKSDQESVFTAELGILKKQVNEKNKRMEELKEEVKSKVTEVESLKKRLAQEAQRFDERSKDVNNHTQLLMKENQKLKEQITSFNAETKFSNQRGSMENEKLKEEISILKKAVEEAENKQFEYQSDYNLLKIQHKNLQDRLEIEKSSLSDKGHLEEVQTKNAELRMKIIEVGKEKILAEERTAEAKRDADELVGKLHDKERTIKTNLKIIEELEQRVQQLESLKRDSETKEKQMGHLRNSLTEKTEELQQAKQENGKLLEENNTLQQSIETLRVKVESIQQEMAKSKLTSSVAQPNASNNVKQASLTQGAHNENRSDNNKMNGRFYVFNNEAEISSNQIQPADASQVPKEREVGARGPRHIYRPDENAMETVKREETNVLGDGNRDLSQLQETVQYVQNQSHQNSNHLIQGRYASDHTHSYRSGHQANVDEERSKLKQAYRSGVRESSQPNEYRDSGASDHNIHNDQPNNQSVEAKSSGERTSPYGVGSVSSRPNRPPVQKSQQGSAPDLSTGYNERQEHRPARAHVHYHSEISREEVLPKRADRFGDQLRLDSEERIYQSDSRSRLQGAAPLPQQSQQVPATSMPTLLQLLESENKILLDKFSLAKQDQMAAENRTEELRRRVQLLSTQLMEAEEKIQWHKNRMDAKDREVASMEEEINRLREERDHYRTKNGSSNYSVSSEQKSRQVRVVSQQDGDLKRIRELQTEVEELNSRLRAAEEDQRQLVTERKKNALLEEEKERLIRAIRELEIKLEAADREVANTQERIHRIAQAQVRAELEDESKLKGMSQELREEQKALEHRAVV
jgi:chromosome segregation ATPase